MPGIMKSLNRISRCQSVYRNDKVKVEGICACHHAFVLIISKNPGSSQEYIAREICLNKSTVARALNHLEKYGYIIRRPNPDDKREFLVYPTEKMLAVLPEIRAVSARWNDLITQEISQKELETFHRVLDRMADSAKHIIEEL